VAESILVGLASIVVLGVSAQWLASRLGLPSILLLLIFGVVAGPVLGWIRPDVLMAGHDELLFAVVSLAVALILYEGGLTLKLSELPKVGAVVRNLVTLGALVTWIITATAAHLIFGFDIPLSALVGALLIVTGPTVIGPLLRQIRPMGNTGPILKWEGIVIDPIGALLAVLTFEIVTGTVAQAPTHVAIGILKTIVFGGGIGVAAAGLLVLPLARYWIADHLQNAASLMFVVAAFTLSNHLQEESGLLAVTVMGFALANQKWVDVKHIVEFKENLQVLLISCLFIVLAARVEIDAITDIAGRGLLFVAVLILVARPIGVFLSTLGSGLALRERVFLACMAPRGIVAAAVASVFAMRLGPDAGLLVPVTFITIITTVAVYGIGGSLIARWLGVAETRQQGVLFVGAHDWARELAAVLQREGRRVLLVDSNWDNINAAKMAGLPTYAGSALADHTLGELDLGGIGRLLAVTQNDSVNALTVHRFEGIFGKASCFQLVPHEASLMKLEHHKHAYGRLLFDKGRTYEALTDLYRAGFTIKATGLSETFDYAAYREHHGEDAVPLLLMDAKGRLDVITAGKTVAPQPGDTIIALVRDTDR